MLRYRHFTSKFGMVFAMLVSMTTAGSGQSLASGAARDGTPQSKTDPLVTALDEQEMEALPPVPVIIHGDFNGDGWEDMADWDGTSLTVWLGDSQGTFERLDRSSLATEERSALVRQYLSLATAVENASTILAGTSSPNDLHKLISCTGTSVGQVNGTPSGLPGSIVTAIAGLSEYSGLGRYSALIGPVKLYQANSSGGWTYLNTHWATGISGSGFINTYASATWRLRIASGATRNRYIRLQYRYDAQNGFCSSIGYGQIYVR